MKLYNIEKDKIEIVKSVVFNGARYSVEAISKDDLFEAGYCKIDFKSRPNSRYYNYTQTASVIDKVYVIDYLGESKTLIEIKDRMTKDLAQVAKNKFEVNTQKYHSAEMSHFDRLYRQSCDYLDTGRISTLMQSECDITRQSVDSFVAIVMAKSVFLDSQKAYISGTRKVKEIEIEALIDIDACILYEATPHTEDVEDVETGEMVETTLYRNNITHWTKPYQE